MQHLIIVMQRVIIVTSPLRVMATRFIYMHHTSLCENTLKHYVKGFVCCAHSTSLYSTYT
jgi:hypothetical protein